MLFSALELSGWATAILTIIGTLIVFARPVLRYIAKRKEAGQSVDILGVALAFAEGYDAAKAELPPEAKRTVSSALAAAAERSGATADTQRFLERFGFNPKVAGTGTSTPAPPTP